MAERALSQDSLTCSICLEILKDPVTLPCGHNYCMDCIQTNWNKEVSFSCPQCRKSFTPRPDLAKNTVLANLVEELKTTGLIAPPADHCYAGPEDVSCDICTGRKLKAVSSCLQCQVSYCETHLQPHRNVVKLQRHQLVAPSDELEEQLCSEHNEVKKLFCRTEQEIICSLCCVDQHKGHDTVSSAAERAQRQKQLEAKRALLQQNLQDTETEQERLHQEAQEISRSAQTAVQQSGEMFTQTILLLEKRRSEVEQEIRSQEQIQLNHVLDLQDQVQHDITALKKTISEMDKLFLTSDHNQFILLCSSLSTNTEKTDSRIQATQRKNFEDITTTVSELKDKLQITLRGFELPKPEPITRKDFIRYACDITLDPNTASKNISLSDENRRAELMSEKQSYPDHPDRFVTWYEVLSRESLTGCCYFEVEWSGKDAVTIALSYKDIKRKGTRDECGFGRNNKSWGLDCRKKSYTFYFNQETTTVPGPFSSRIGVYLNHSAGTLSFHSVQGQTMSLIHKVQTTFSKPLFVGVWFGNAEDTIHFLKLT